MVLEVISRGEYMTFGMQGKDIRRHLEDISPSAMSRIFKRLRLHGIIERFQGTYKYFTTAYGKAVIAAGLTVRNLVLIVWLSIFIRPYVYLRKIAITTSQYMALTDTTTSVFSLLSHIKSLFCKNRPI